MRHFSSLGWVGARLLGAIALISLAGAGWGMPIPGLPAEGLVKIQAAIPKEAQAKPKKPRKVLVFNHAAGFVHSSIPYGMAALELMGKQTGAYEVVQTSDTTSFEASN